VRKAEVNFISRGVGLVGATCIFTLTLYMNCTELFMGPSLADPWSEAHGLIQSFLHPMFRIQDQVPPKYHYTPGVSVLVVA
jgi:hypothetical protein